MTACIIRIPVQYFLDRSPHRCCDFVYVDMPARAGHERLYVVDDEGKCRMLDRQPKSEVIAPSNGSPATVFAFREKTHWQRSKRCRNVSRLLLPHRKSVGKGALARRAFL
jgi:hypothetical protein